MSRPLIAIDIDDVIAETTESMRLWSNQKAGRELTREQFSQTPGDYWGYYERVWAEHDITNLENVDFQIEMTQDTVRVPLLADAQFAIHELLKRYDVVLVSARAELLREHTERWIEEHFPNSGIKLYLAANHQAGERLDRTKGQICKELGAFILIDDNTDHCQSALDAGLEAIVFGIYGWQQRVSEAAVRCRDWPEVLEYFNGR